MALAVSAGCAALVLIIFLITVALGNHVLEISGLTADHSLDTVLFSSGAVCRHQARGGIVLLHVRASLQTAGDGPPVLHRYPRDQEILTEVHKLTPRPQH
jgi:hypothetical protein